MAPDVNIDYPWYSITPRNDPLSQGDLIDGLIVVFPYLDKNGKWKADKAEFDVVVMTQSCDLVDMHDDDLVLLCPRDSPQQAQGTKLLSNWKNLVDGKIINQHLIDKCEIKGYEFDYQIINLKYVITMKFSLLKQQVETKKNRVSIMPPYREYMGQAFARQFMRIGLPNTIPSVYPG